MQLYCESIFEYKRLKTREVNVGGLLLGNYHPIRIQTMTTPDTMDTKATVEQSIRCIEAGSELIRITAPSKNEASNLQNIKDELRKRGYNTPIVADIHFTPNAAEIAARIVEKVRINPGNYVDKKKFEQIEYSDADYAEEIDRIRERFTPLIRICKEYGTAMRIGTNHGSLSDRIMSRYGDTPMGMVESAMEFLRIARHEAYHNIVLSMKSSNPLVMVEAYRLLVKSMFEEFKECYPLHLGVTEAGDGEDGRIKSAIGIGTLLEDGLGDTIRVSLTEDPEFEIPVCKDIVRRYASMQSPVASRQSPVGSPEFEQSIPGDKNLKLPYDPFSYLRRKTFAVENIGGKHVPVVIADLSKINKIGINDLQSIGYSYDTITGEWNIADAAADYLYTADQLLDFDLPASLNVIINAGAWKRNDQSALYIPIFSASEFLSFQSEKQENAKMKFVMCDEEEEGGNLFMRICNYLKDNTDQPSSVVLCFSSTKENAMQSVRKMFIEIENYGIRNPVILITDSNQKTADEHLIHFATETGALLLDGFGDGICLGYSNASPVGNVDITGRTYLNVNNIHQFTNNTAFSILQAARTRISKTDYISCPSCGRTLFDLQQITAKIREVTNHLKGVKIAVMGCIVNGPGEMADADFGYVGSGPGKITLYKGKEIVKRNVDSDVAVGELIQLIKENGAWVSP